MQDNVRSTPGLVDHLDRIVTLAGRFPFHGLAGFDAESTPDVLNATGLPASGLVDAARLSNATDAVIDLAPASGEPAVAPIYQLDSIVRRAMALQLTADGRAGAARMAAQEVQA